MRLTNLLLINNGPISNLSLEFSAGPDGNPKPIVLVGTNGSGKTAVLSVIADAIYEAQALHFRDVASPLPTGGHSYFRVLGPRNITSGSAYEIDALRLVHGDNYLVYRAKAGSVDPATVRDQLQLFPGAETFPQEGNAKDLFGSGEWLSEELNSHAYLYFPTGRSEVPHWMNSDLVDRDPQIPFTIRIAGILNKNFVISSSIQRLKPWIAALILDITVDASVIFSFADVQQARQYAATVLAQFPAWNMLNTIISIILDRPDAHFVRTNRSFGDGRIAIAFGTDVRIPTLDHLSAGQSALLSIFGSIIMYSDPFMVPGEKKTFEGVVLIDEIDQHLHTSLQYEALPKLMKLFPGVQFVVTSHSPMFPLGMEREFTSDGFYLIEMPTGIRIDAERFGEFRASFERLQETKAFDEAVRTRLGTGQKKIICEGETDPAYLRAAAAALKFERLANEVEFDWIGQVGSAGARGGGKDGLDAAARTFRNNPGLLTAKTVLLYDLDAKKQEEDAELMSIRSIIRNPANTLRTGGIENLLSPESISDRFFHDQEIKAGDDRGVVRKLDKTALCHHLCDAADAASFEGFRPTLQMLDLTLFGSADSDEPTRPTSP